MPRRCFTVGLATELAAEYAKRHRPGAVWPEVLAFLEAQGIEEMEIWQAGDRLFMIAEVTPDYPRPVPMPAAVARWEEEMWRYQRPLPDAPAGEKWAPMDRVFAATMDKD
jgi:L-rhamnose mutarotase